MTKLLLSLPLSAAAQRFYGSTAPTYNKAGDAGIDLPFISTAQPYDIQTPQTLMRLDFGTVFAMYDLEYKGSPFSLFDFLLEVGYGASADEHRNLCVIAKHYQPSHFSIRPRSSIDKTPYRLSNSVGTIDKEYRGIQIETYHESEYWTGDTIKASLDYFPWLGSGDTVKAYLNFGDRLLQIVAPNLDNILWVRLDFTEENCSFWSEVIGNKQRSGFGSTN